MFDTGASEVKREIGIVVPVRPLSLKQAFAFSLPEAVAECLRHETTRHKTTA